MLELVSHVVEVSEGVLASNSVHFARTEGSPGDQALNMAKSVHPDLHYYVSGRRLVLHEKGGAKKPYQYFN